MTAPGSWTSPLSAADVTTAAVAVRQASYGPDGAVWWAEQRPQEGGRTVLLREGREQVPTSFDARSAFHEYGGMCWLPVLGGVVSSSWADQRLWLVPESGEPRPLTPAGSGGAAPGDRYALPQLLPPGDALLCLRERLDPVRNELAVVPLSGSAADDGGQVTVLWDGSDFVDAARVSSDGTALAFLTWDHPRMPWDGTELRVAALGTTGLGPSTVVLGGPAEAVFQPEWDDAGLRAVTDRSGWWNLVRAAGRGADGAGANGQGSDGRGADGQGSAGPESAGPPVPLWEVEQECGWPGWVPGYASHASLPGGAVAVLHGRSTQQLGVLHPDGRVVDVQLPFTSFAPVLCAHGSRVLTVAGSPSRPWTVIEVDIAGGSWREVTSPATPDPAWTPVPDTVAVPSTGGRTTWAHVYPPTAPGRTGSAPAPYVLMVHGGPTAQASLAYDPAKAFWTSRGFGVADVDHGGSSGRGRAYRELLRGRWGVVDVEDCEAVARWLLESGRASAVVIRGGSAGGWTVLSALTRGDSVFAAGASHYGVADLASFAADTHDFESRYLDSLVPPDQYATRSPLSHTDRLDRPLLVLQGLDDKVVPPEQARLLVDALAERGVPHAAVYFAGEGHGFRRRETQVAALEGELAFYGQVLGFATPGVPPVPLVTGAGDASSAT